MKKVLKIIGIVLVALILVAVVYSTGLYDTRFWFYDKNVYKPFYTGNYICGKDFEPGTYEVEIRGGSKNTGTVDITKPNEESYVDNNFWVHQGDKGFRFTVEEGDLVQVNVMTGRDMKYKKVE